MDIIYLLDVLGTFFFAISGALAADEKKLDVFGVTFIAFITAVGGGTTRDLVLNLHPLVWIKDANHFIIIALGVVFAVVFKKYIQHLRKAFFLFDSIGIGFFTIMGMKKALLLAHVSPMVAVLMGMVSATFGGVFRDVFCNEIPLIFRREIYATACLAGAIFFMVFEKILPNSDINTVLSILIIIVIRVLAVKYKLSLSWHKE